ncbi:MAG: MinD/ParA family protein [Pseudonocardia sp.]|nr:MinD/ParA family protein [Pseudonocardia sp.]
MEPALGLAPFGAPAPPAPNPPATPTVPTPAPLPPAAEPPVPPGTVVPSAPRNPAPASAGTVVKPETAAVAPTGLTAAAIGHDQVVRSHGEIPRFGWRAAVYETTGGRINLGVGRAERAHQRLMEQVRAPLPGTRHIAVTSIKGGVGKTTVAACLGLMLAEYRGEGVIAVDADPDAGTLADRLTGATTVTVRDLLVDLDKITSLGQFGAYTTLAGRLRVLAGEQDPAMGEAFRREDYQRVCGTLARFFDIVITDSGTGLVHSAMRGTLELADTLIVVGTPTVDGASRASKTLDWLQAHGYHRLAEEAVVVLSHDRRSRRVDRKRLREHFGARCGHVVEIPADAHLYSGGLIKSQRLAPATAEAFLHLAAVIADGFGTPKRPLALPSGRP